jgi:acyl-coenzyme A synthetase/AMP-(fatty) acid ligase
MQTLPLLSAVTLDALLIMRGDGAVSVATFIAQAESLAARLPDQPYLINLAEDRHHFLLGWVAACLRDQVMLLPPNLARATLDELVREHPRNHVFDDGVAARLLASSTPRATALPAWTLPVDRVTAIVFTSGTTGRPQAHPKTWGSLFHNSRLAARDVLGGMARSIVATVPAQHMYGLEASLLGALTAGCRLFDRKPFFPADVRAALAAMPEPRTLVTTPAHLRVLTAAGLDMPRVERIVSATAPLPVDLAREVEKRWRTGVFEIYGCTEAGVVAHRRTTQSARWCTLAGGTMASVDGAAEYRAPQLAGPVSLPDIIESHGDTAFTLLGRAAEMIKVAGKRSSLQELTAQVLSVSGVRDAAVFVPEGTERPAAAVVAPGLTSAQLLAELRRIMEPVFVPRPLVLVDALPRNELGKLPREALLRLVRPAEATAVIRIPADHPALAGHFPGNPLVPGVVLLEAVLAQVRACRPEVVASLPAVKFLAPVRPEEIIQLRLEFAETSARFRGLREGTPVFEGSLEFGGVAR